MSGYNFSRMPRVARSLYAWPGELFTVQDLRSRSFLALYLACASHVSMVAGVFPSAIVSLLRALDEHADELASSFGKGTLPSWLELSPEQRRFFDARAVRDTALSARLKKVPSLGQGEKVPWALPALRLVYCWTASTAGAFLPELSSHLGPNVAIRDAIYSACEGWCSIPMGEEQAGGAVGVTSHYLEFIEEEAFESGRREAVGVEGLEQGKRYYIVMTTSGGLYRYLIGDILEVCGAYRQVPRIRFVRKAGAAANLAGEKLLEIHVTTALERVQKELGLLHSWYTLAPHPGQALPGYALYIELRTEAKEGLLQTLAKRVDDELGAAAVTYGRLRRAKQLAPLLVRPLEVGSYDAYRQERIRTGVADAQLKTTHLYGEQDKVPELLRARAGAPVSSEP
jgi:hypothetical protein